MIKTPKKDNLIEWIRDREKIDGSDVLIFKFQPFTNGDIETEIIAPKDISSWEIDRLKKIFSVDWVSVSSIEYTNLLKIRLTFNNGLRSNNTKKTRK